VQVIDTGIGIAEDEQAQVFEAFYQVRHRDRTMARGLGLGLSIVQRLATLLDHPLTLRSSLGRGSVFSLALTASAEPAAPAHRPEAAIPAPTLGPGLRIALAEDDASAREALGVLLVGWGCEVVAADSGDALLHRLAAAPGPWPEVLVTDHHMPGTLDGPGLALRWRERLGATAPVLLVSADPALPAGAADFDRLPKPLQPERLAAWLAQVQQQAQHADGPAP
jgi:CheY-like chemotaxis protein